MRLISAALLAATLSACSTGVPDSGAPVDAPLGPAPTAGRSASEAPLAAPGAVGTVETMTLSDDGTTAQAGTATGASAAPMPATQPTPHGVVSYALATTNAVGEKLYRRGILALPALAARNCAKYPSDDAAQEAFLAAGGPERDRLNLDPDGDGFACNWDPAPYRRLAAQSG